MSSDYFTLRQYTPERLELELSPAKWHVDREQVLKHHQKAGQEAVTRDRPKLDVRYGEGPLQTLDIFAADSSDAPCCLVIHGGFWRISDKSAFSFLGGFLKSQGVSAVVCNFDMCPAVTIDDIVSQIGEALDWICQNGPAHGLSADRIYLLGHATGAHLAAMMLSNFCDGKCWQSRIGGSFLLSGLYDLRLVPSISVNSVLHLDSTSAQRNSPVLRPFGIAAPLVIAAATLETAEFREQSREYAQKAVSDGIAVTYVEIENVGHFSILDAIARADGPGMTEFLSLVRSRG